MQLWLESDYELLNKKLKVAYPHSHYFRECAIANIILSNIIPLIL